jgi:Sigma-70, region 4
VVADQRVGPVAQPPQRLEPDANDEDGENTRLSLPSTKLRLTASSMAMSTANAARPVPVTMQCAALQHLPPRQRAALVLRDAVGFRAAETAAILGCTVDAANNLLKRARATIARHLPQGGRDEAPLPGSAREHQVTARFADAFERGDVHAIVALLTDDAWRTMPPLPFGYHGRDAVGHFLDAVSFRPGTRRSRLVPTGRMASPPSPTICATRTRRSAMPTDCSCSPLPATASAASPASSTTASSPGSGSPAPSPDRPARAARQAWLRIAGLAMRALRSSSGRAG